ncbi:MAG: EAL domain-containing protein [Candidatus Woesearchaeota archaeon]
MLLETLLAPGALAVVFQPIYALRPGGGQDLYGFEALTRGPVGTNAARADILFEYVRRKRVEAVVDRVCVDLALQAAVSLPDAACLSLNVHASTLGRDAGFTDHLLRRAAEYGVAAERLVVEVVEHSSHWNVFGLKRALEVLRDRGVRTAIDDLGLGHSNLHMVLESCPQILKLDRYFVGGAARDAARRGVLRAVQLLAASVGAQVVAEGIEHEDDLFAVRAEGIALAQGYLFSRPLPASAFVPAPRSTSLPVTA